MKAIRLWEELCREVDGLYYCRVADRKIVQTLDKYVITYLPLGIADKRIRGAAADRLCLTCGMTEARMLDMIIREADEADRRERRREMAE